MILSGKTGGNYNNQLLDICTAVAFGPCLGPCSQECCVQILIVRYVRDLALDAQTVLISIECIGSLPHRGTI